jgi:hypothetical protein
MRRRLRLRLGAWYVLCAGLLIGHLFWFIALRSGPAYGWAGALLVILALIAVLLVTTPTDAIRLPRLRSEILIAASVVYLELGAVLIASTQPMARVALASVAVVGVTLVMLRWLRGRDYSAWWAVLVAWNPLLIHETGVVGREEAMIGLLVAAVMGFMMPRGASR